MEFLEARGKIIAKKWDELPQEDQAKLREYGDYLVTTGKEKADAMEKENEVLEQEREKWEKQQQTQPNS